jgi:hypothetical protein
MESIDKQVEKGDHVGHSSKSSGNFLFKQHSSPNRTLSPVKFNRGKDLQSKYLGLSPTPAEDNISILGYGSTLGGYQYIERDIGKYGHDIDFTSVNQDLRLRLDMCQEEKFEVEKKLKQ